MPSPFPGMDPYLEQHWGDVHTSLVYLIRAQIQKRLPRALVARIEERVYVEPEEYAERRYVEPDVRIAESYQVREVATAYGSSVSGPFVLEVDDIHDPVTERWIKIIEHEAGDRIVTTIELLSPGNKISGEGKRKYLQKRAEMMDAGVNIVEIDLTRRGTRELLSFDFGTVPNEHRAVFEASVWRAVTPKKVEHYALPLREPLKPIAIPLRTDDKDVFLELQPLVAECYEVGRFDTINYSIPPRPPLKDDDAIWSAEVVKSRGQ